MSILKPLHLILLVFVMCGACHSGNGGGAVESAGPIDRHNHHLILTKHARCRMDCRHITEKEILEILDRGEINYRKSDPNGHPDPKYALDGSTDEGQHLRVVFATSPRGPVVVTCIDLDHEWQCDCGENSTN